MRFVVCLVFLVAGCASNGPLERTHVSIDGQPVGKARYDQIVSVCQGRVASGVVMAPNTPRDPYASIAESVSRGGSVQAVFNGCMAEHGLVRRAQ